MTPEIIILAMVAAFLGLRLYSVLGKRTGHEQEPLPRRMDNPLDGRPVPAPNAPDIAEERSDEQAKDDNIASLNPVVTPAAEPGLRQIAQADRGFDPVRFIVGAKSAYGMILDAFWSGNKEDLDALTDEEVFGSFSDAIDDRETRGETLENRLVRIEKAEIVDAELDNHIARVTIRFDADIAAVVRDQSGELVAGSLTDAVETHDIWTFARDVRSDTPEWILVETDEA